MADIAFDNLQQFSRRLNSLLRMRYDFITGFWNSKQFCFSSNDPNTDGVNLTTTCFCLFSILEDPLHTSRFSEEKKSTSIPDPLTKIANVLLDADWTSEKLPKFNIYTSPIVITTLHRLKIQFNNGKIINGLNHILKNVKQNGAASFANYSPSAYLTYWSAKALQGAVSNPLLDQKLLDDCSKALDKIVNWAEIEVHRQLSLIFSGDTASFDVIQLAYALVIYVEGYRRTNQHLNLQIISKSIDVIFSSQLRDGLWPKCHPLFHYETRGNVYTFSFEMLDILLSIANDYSTYFRHYIKNLETSVEWTQQNILECKRNGHLLQGWRSNNLSFKNGPEAWSTAAVFNALLRIDCLIQLYIKSDTMLEFNATQPTIPNQDSLIRIYDSDIKISGDKKSLKELIKRYLIDPHLSVASGTHALNAKYSAVFFGPPGTSKTSLSEAIADALGWPFINLQTIDFLKDGFDKVTMRASYIFEKLGSLDKAVILFDEVEEFVRDRLDNNLPTESRMLTTSMLPLIQGLRKQKKVIFIVATNFLNKFDSAITRAGGRFDLIFLISPPFFI